MVITYGAQWLCAGDLTLWQTTLVVVAADRVCDKLSDVIGHKTPDRPP
ncbi:MAG: hypothetical protein ACPGVS_06960 [Primorskyibacter sp.]